MTPSWPSWGRSATRFGLGVLITASIVFVLAMPSEPAAWSVVALVVVLGTTMGQSVTSAVNRMAGSVVGCVTGAVVQVTMPWLWLPLRVMIAVLACMLICRLLRLTAGQRLGMALAGFFVFVPGDEEWQTVGWRLLATLIGITVALVITLVLWPSRARDRLTEGIAAVLADVRSSLEADRRRLHGDDVPTAKDPASVAALRPLVGERRYEPPGRGPSATALSGILDGLDLAVAGVRRLDVVSTPGPQALAPALARDLDPVFDDLDSSCAALIERIEGTDARRSGGAAVTTVRDLAGVDGVLSAALEGLRATHLTLAADAAELRDLFAAVEALSLVASGLSRVDVSLGSQVQH
jgi:uncharacterized membrane protein YccC